VCVEEAATPQRDTHRLEVTGSDNISKYVVAALVTVFELRTVHLRFSATEGQQAGERRRGNARDVAHLFQCLRDELMPGAIVVESVARLLYFHGEQARNIDGAVLSFSLAISKPCLSREVHTAQDTAGLAWPPAARILALEGGKPLELCSCER
jgi:hypothetical protein